MLTEKQQQAVSTFLFNAGHAHPRFMGDNVIYRDQTRGYHATDKMVSVSAILELVEDKGLYALNKLNIRLIMLQLDPNRAIWQYWDHWDSLPDHVYEMSEWSNSLPKLFQVAADDHFWKGL